MGNQNDFDAHVARMSTRHDEYNRDIFEVIARDTMILEIVAVLYCLVYQIYKATQHMGNVFLTNEMLIILDNAFIPLAIFWIPMMLASAVKLVKNHKNEVKQPVTLYKICLIFGGIIGVAFGAAYLFFSLN